MNRCFCDRCLSVVQDESGCVVHLEDKNNPWKKELDFRRSHFDLCDDCRDALYEWLMTKED